MFNTRTDNGLSGIGALDVPGHGLEMGLFLWTFETEPCLSIKSSLAFERSAVSARPVEAVLLLSSSLSRSRTPSLAPASVAFHFRTSGNFRSISAIFWRHQNGAKWRALPSEFGPWWIVAQLFIRWSKLGV